MFLTDVIYFSTFSPFQRTVWTIRLRTKFPIRRISEKKQESLERVPPAKLLLNLVFEGSNAEKNENLQICVETSETARRAPLGALGACVCGL